MAKFRGLQLPSSASLGKLLPMLYTPTELAAEIGCNAHQIRQTALAHGCPHTRDDRDRIWINGKEFAAWYSQTQIRRKHPMALDEAWCLTCRQPVRMVGPLSVVPRHGAAELARGTCPLCGNNVNRLRSTEVQP